MKVKFDQLTIGSILRNKRNGKEFKVIALLPEESKVELINLETQETIKVLDRTFERWYSVESLAEEAQEVEEEKEEVQESPKKALAPKVAKKAAGPRVRASAPRPKVVKEDIQESSDKEVVEVKAAPKRKERSATPKSDHVLAITKKLETLISQAYPGSRREVTKLYIKYRHKYAFVRIFQSKSKVRIAVLTRTMPESVKKHLDKIVGPTYNWPLDGLFDIKSEADLEVAMELIGYSHTAARQ